MKLSQPQLQAHEHQLKCNWARITCSLSLEHYSTIPDKRGTSFHNYAHARKMQGQLCTFATGLVSYLSPLARQRCLPSGTSHRMNTPRHGAQEISTKAVFLGRLRKGTSLWICIALNQVSSPVQCLLCKTGTCHSRLHT